MLYYKYTRARHGFEHLKYIQPASRVMTNIKPKTNGTNMDAESQAMWDELDSFEAVPA